MKRTRTWVWSLFGLVLVLAAAALFVQSRNRGSSLQVSWVGVRAADGALVLSPSNAGPDGLQFHPKCSLLIDPTRSGSWQAYPLSPSNWLTYGGFIGAGQEVPMRWNPPTSGVPARLVLSYSPSATDPSRPIGKFANLLFDLGIRTRPAVLLSTSPPVVLPR